MATWGPTELFVTNFVGTTEELGTLFKVHGQLREFWVSQKKAGAVARPDAAHFGIVRYALHEDALRARKALHGGTHGGRTLGVRWAQNQRVLRVADLAPSVTNEALEAAFAQFGPIERALVVSDAASQVSRRYGYVAFEKKPDAQRAVKLAGENLFLVGAGARPVQVQLALTEDVDEGYSDELHRAAQAAATKRGRSGEHMPPAAAQEHKPGHFAAASTAEFVAAMQLRSLQVQYQLAKQRLKAQMAEGEAAIMMGRPLPDQLQVPALVPTAPGAELAAPFPVVAPAAGAAPLRHAPQRSEDYSHVPPPRRALQSAHGDPAFERYSSRPRTNPLDAPPPDLATAPAAGGGGGFVRGGELSTIEPERRMGFTRGGGLHIAGPGEDNGGGSGVGGVPPAPPGPASGVPQAAFSMAAPPPPAMPHSPAAAPGVKAPGRYDPRGLGFEGHAGASGGGGAVSAMAASIGQSYPAGTGAGGGFMGGPPGGGAAGLDAGMAPWSMEGFGGSGAGNGGAAYQPPAGTPPGFMGNEAFGGLPPGGGGGGGGMYGGGMPGAIHGGMPGGMHGGMPGGPPQGPPRGGPFGNWPSMDGQLSGGFGSTMNAMRPPPGAFGMHGPPEGPPPQLPGMGAPPAHLGRPGGPVGRGGPPAGPGFGGAPFGGGRGSR